jgi:tRNA (cmo5U34)-methyltransferase
MTHSPPVFDPARYFDQDVAARYDQGIRLSCPGYDALHRMLMPLLQLLPPEAAFLCAGAGTGSEVMTLAARFGRWRFVAVDVSASMLDECRRRTLSAGIADRVTLHAGRMEDFDGTVPFDAASSLFVTHFIKGPKEKLAYVQSIAAHLKPGALFVLGDLFGDKGSAEFVQLMQAWLLYYVSHGANAEKLTADLQHIFDNIDFVPETQLRVLLMEAGFCDVARFFQSYLFGGWIARKQT